MRYPSNRFTAPFLAIPHVWKASKVPFLSLSFILLLQGLIAPASALLLGRTVEYYLVDSFQNTLVELAVPWTLLLFLGIFSFPVTFVLSGRINEDLTTYLTELLLRRGLSLKTLELFDNPQTHDLISIVSKESKSRPVNYIVLYSYILRSMISVVAFAFFLGNIAWYLPLLVILASLPLHYAYTNLREANWRGLRQRTKDARYLEYLTSVFLSRELALESRALGLNQFVRDEFFRVRTDMLSGLHRDRIAGFKKTLPYLVIGAVLYSGSMVILLMSVQTTALAVASITAAIQAFVSLQHAVSEVVENMAFLREKAFFFRDLNTLLSLKESTLPDTSHEESPTPVANGGKANAFIEFRDVSFCYPGATSNTLQNVNFEVNNGEVVAVVGENGAGKSTILKLLCGFYGPTAGFIKCNGESLTSANVSQWRQSISPIFQQTHAFAFSMAQNIEFSLNTEPSLVDLALTRAYGSEIPCTKEDQLGVEFGGTELSGGELQRLGLSRAYYRDCELVIMDEPTSAIDPIFERATFDSIREFVRGRTALIVTHRMPQALFADRVLVIEGGKIVENGTPRALLKAGGIFARMVKSQVSTYDNSDAE